MTETAIGVDGMKIDRKLYEKFEETVRQDQYVQRQVADGNFTAAEQYVVQEFFDKQDDYINMDKLSRAINVDRKVNLRGEGIGELPCLGLLRSQDTYRSKNYDQRKYYFSHCLN